MGREVLTGFRCTNRAFVIARDVMKRLEIIESVSASRSRPRSRVAPGRGTRRRSWWNHYPWARPLKAETRVWGC